MFQSVSAEALRSIAVSRTAPALLSSQAGGVQTLNCLTQPALQESSVCCIIDHEKGFVERKEETSNEKGLPKVF